MKFCLLIFLIFILQLSLTAQNRLTVNQRKATHLVCPDRVSYLQVGDASFILAEKVPELPNLIRLKAVQPFESESSLTVVCSNRIYSLILEYGDTDEITSQLETFDFEEMGSYSEGMLPNYLLESLSDQVLGKRKGRVKRKEVQKDGIRLRLEKIYLKNDVLFLELAMTNQTNLTYSIAGFHWWITDRRTHRATNVQEYPIFPAYQRKEVEKIPAQTTVREVFALPKLMIPDHRVLKIDLLEKALGNTGRKLTLEIRNKDILKARQLQEP